MFVFQKKLLSKCCVVVSDALVPAYCVGTVGEKADSEVMTITSFVD